MIYIKKRPVQNSRRKTILYRSCIKSTEKLPVYIKNPNKIPAATAEPITPATFGPIACINK